MAGLQLICAMRSARSVTTATRAPRRDAASAASHPACPAPTTTTSNAITLSLPDTKFGEHTVEHRCVDIAPEQAPQGEGTILELRNDHVQRRRLIAAGRRVSASQSRTERSRR